MEATEKQSTEKLFSPSCSLVCRVISVVGY